jgi:hypothetical protein
MKLNFQEICGWLKSVLSEADGSGSATRVLMFILVLAAIVWSSVLLVDVHKHKYTMEQFSGYLTSVGQYLTITATPLYATNKIATVIDNKNTQNQQNGGQ